MSGWFIVLRIIWHWICRRREASRLTLIRIANKMNLDELRASMDYLESLYHMKAKSQKINGDNDNGEK